MESTAGGLNFFAEAPKLGEEEEEEEEGMEAGAGVGGGLAGEASRLAALNAGGVVNFFGAEIVALGTPFSANKLNLVWKEAFGYARGDWPPNDCWPLPAGSGGGPPLAPVVLNGAADSDRPARVGSEGGAS